MEGLKLSDEEQQCFGKLFSCCDPENVGKVTWNKALELFISSQLPLETLSKITELCGVERVGQFKRSQFYIALKLIAAAQNGHSIDLESFQHGTDLPLPTFSKSEDKDLKFQEQQHAFSSVGVSSGNIHDGNTNTYIQQQSFQNSLGVILPPPPANRSHARVAAQSRPNNSFPADNNSASVLQPQAVLPTNQANSPIDLDHCHSSAPSSPVCGNHTGPDQVPGKTWASYPKPDNQPTWMHFEEQHQLLSNEDDSSDRHSSDEEDDPFVLTKALRNYYTDHFKTLQSDLEGVIPGSSVKQFFEQSGLPNQELSKIWQHADIDRDGALSLEEFFIAMHLIVVRKNQIELPDVLPSSLLPQSFKKQDQVVSPYSPTAADNSLNMKEKQWTKFNDSPVSSISSPSMKPVNFDFPSAAIEQDPKILHPVPLRLSPDQVISDDGQDALKIRTVSEPVHYKPLQNASSPTNCRSPKKAFDVSTQDKSSHSASQAIQRPIPRKPSAPGRGAIPPPPPNQPISPGENEESKNTTRNLRSSSYSGPSSNTPSNFHAAPKKEPPPPPPPRPRKNHARSSSLDLNRLSKPVLGNPPAVPPRISPANATPKKLVGQYSESDAGASNEPVNFADFQKFQNSNGYPQKSECKSCDETNPDVDDDDDEEGTDRRRHLSAPLLSVRARVTREKKDLLAAIKAYRKHNIVLSRLNNELNQELSESMEERIALELQLERLKPFSS